MSKSHNIGEGPLTSLCLRIEMAGNLDGRRIEKWHKPISVAFFIIGLTGICTSATGIAALAGVGSLSNLTQLNAIIMISLGGGAGFALILSSVVCQAKVKRNPEIQELAEESTPFKAKTWTFCRQPNGTYNVERKDPTGKRETIEYGHSYEQLAEIAKSMQEEFQWDEDEESYKLPFVQTDPYKETELLINRDSLEKILTDSTFTCVRKVNGAYSLFYKENNEVVKEDSIDNIENLKNSGYTYIKTSPFEPQDLLIEKETLEVLLKHKNCTWVEQVNGNYSLVIRLHSKKELEVKLQDIKPENVGQFQTILKLVSKFPFVETSQLPADESQ